VARDDEEGGVAELPVHEHPGHVGPRGLRDGCG
jgi:hypothetical protein